jgi:hypothetical protein
LAKLRFFDVDTMAAIPKVDVHHHILPPEVAGRASTKVPNIDAE